MVGSVKGRPDEMVEAGVGAVEYPLAGLLAGSDFAEQDAGVADQKASRLNPDLQVLIDAIPNMPDLRIEFLDVQQFLLRPVLDADSASDVDVLELGEQVRLRENILGGLDEDFLVLGLEVGADVLVQADHLDAGLGAHLDALVDFVLRDAELALRASRDHIIILPRALIRVQADKYFMPRELPAEVLQGVQGSNVHRHSRRQSIFHLLLADEVLRKQDLLGTVPQAQGLRQLPGGHHIHVVNASIPQDPKDLGVAVGLHGIGDMETVGSVEKVGGLPPDDVLGVEVEGEAILVGEVLGLGVGDEGFVHLNQGY